jgi:hypothetical protein
MVAKRAAEPGVSQAFSFECNHCQKECKQGSPPEFIQTIIDGEPVKYSVCTDCNRLIQAYVEEQEYVNAEKELGRPIKRNHKPGVLQVLARQEMALQETKEAEIKAAKPIAEVQALTQQVSQLQDMVKQLLAGNNGRDTGSKKPKESAKAKAGTRNGSAGKRVSPDKHKAGGSEVNGASDKRSVARKDKKGQGRLVDGLASISLETGIIPRRAAQAKRTNPKHKSKQTDSADDGQGS